MHHIDMFKIRGLNVETVLVFHSNKVIIYTLLIYLICRTCLVSATKGKLFCNHSIHKFQIRGVNVALLDSIITN